MSKIKDWQQDEVQSQVQKAESIISSLIQKNYTDTLQQTKDDVFKVFTDQHSDMIYAFNEKASGVDHIDKENAENALSEVIDDMVNEYANHLKTKFS
tara:strand:+ start:933 stop:1223 length:291 start_codon:yes stop_codon:yes gene_type:complete